MPDRTDVEVAVQLLQPIEPGDPRKVGQFALGNRIGSGGFGVVYLGRARDGRPVAVKVMHRRAWSPSDKVVQRFKREVAFLGLLNHDRVPALIDHYVGVGRKWLATRYVPGPTLRALVKRFGPLPPEATLWLAAELADVLVAVHEIGAHRDINPSNVLITPDGPELIDFGIAVQHFAAPVTQDGRVAGTKAYTPSERLEPWYDRNRPEPADIFGLGGVLLYALTGRDPHPSGDPPARREQEVDLSGVPGSLHDLLAGCLDSRWSARPSAAELVARVRPVGADFRSALPPEVARALAAAAASFPVRTSARSARARTGIPAPAPPAAPPMPAARRSTAVERRPAASPGHLSADPLRRAGRWVRPVGDWIQAVVDLPGTGVLVVTVDGRIVALDVRDGHPLWAATLPAGPSGPVAALGGRVHVGSVTGQLHVFDAGDGRPRPGARFGGRIVAVATTGGDLVAAGSDGAIGHLRPGQPEWQWKRTLPASTAPGGLLMVGELGYVAGLDGVVRVVDIRSSRTVGQAPLGSRVVALIPAADAVGVQAALPDGTRVAIGPSAAMRRLPAAGGRPRQVGACRADEGVVVSATLTGVLTGEDASDGSVLFETQVGAVRRSLTARGGYAAVGTVEGALEVRRLRTGDLVWRLPGRDCALEAPAAFIDRGDVVAGWADGTVALLGAAG